MKQSHNNPEQNSHHSIGETVFSFSATILLAITLVAAGLFICCLPIATETLSRIFSQWTDSPFAQNDIVKAAVSTQDYTVGSNDRDALYQMLFEINRNAVEAQAYPTYGYPVFSEETTGQDIEKIATVLAKASEIYTLTPEALSHLDDVYAVISVTKIVLGVVAVGALILCVILGMRYGRAKLGRVFFSAGLAVVVVFCLLTLWIIIDFSGFFASFHTLFFADGTWTFSSRSLLIRMYPTEFWVGMGGIWLATTLLASVCCLIVGSIMKKREKQL